MKLQCNYRLCTISDVRAARSESNTKMFCISMINSSRLTVFCFFLFFMLSAHLNEQLDAYIQKLPKVHLIRAKTRQGLIRARLIGAKQAKGDVLVFLDSHCEANYGWLEPLLARIAHDRTIVVTPDIEVVNLRTFSYARGEGGNNRGVFNWELTFKWRALPDYEKQRRQSNADPIR